MDNYTNRILSTINKYAPLLFKYPNVIGFGLGNKIIDGYSTNIPSITFVVEKKLNLNNIHYYNRIPKEIDGVLTDVIEAGSLSRNYNDSTLPVTAYGKRTLPAYGGDPIKNAQSINPVSGCIAHVVLDSSEKMYILSTADVLTKDETLTAQPDNLDKIIFPGNAALLKDFVPPPPYHPGEPVVIAQGVRVSKIYDTIGDNPYETNVLNAGLAYIGGVFDPDAHKLATTGVQPKRELLKRIKNVYVNDKIFKISPDLGEVSGTVILTYSFLSVKIYSKSYPFSEQIVADMPYSPSDLGTLGLIKSNAIIDNLNSVFGMCIGGSVEKKLTFFTPICEITSRFKIALTELLVDNKSS